MIPNEFEWDSLAYSAHFRVGLARTLSRRRRIRIRLFFPPTPLRALRRLRSDFSARHEIGIFNSYSLFQTAKAFFSSHLFFCLDLCVFSKKKPSRTFEQLIRKVKFLAFVFFELCIELSFPRSRLSR
jgi:hypothetical protein